MSNYGMNMGKGNIYNGKTNINNKTTIKKGRVIISITIGVAIIAVFLLFKFFNHKESIIGKWITDEGKHIEFLSDGTIHQNGYRSLNADIYEVMEEGYLKWGEYDAAWLDYRYTYWSIEINGNHMTLTDKNDSKYTIELTRE